MDVCKRGVINSVIRLNGRERQKQGDQLNPIFISMIEPHLKKINQRNRIKVPIKPVIPLQNENSGELLWVGMHNKKGMEARFEVVLDRMLPMNW